MEYETSRPRSPANIMIVVEFGKRRAWLQNQHAVFSITKVKTDIQC